MNTDILDELSKMGWFENRKIQINTSSQLNIANKFTEEFGNLKYRNTNTKTTYLFLNHNEDIYVNNILFSKIAILNNAILWHLNFIINEKEEIYIYEYKDKIANNINDFFKKIFLPDFYIPLKINPKTYSKLKKSGWYPNRKVNISNMINTLELNGIEIFPKAIEFYEEFYGLEGYVFNNELLWKILNEEEIINYPLISKPNIKTNINEHVFPICSINYGLMNFYISETGKIYTINSVLVGNNALKGFNSIFRC